MQSILLNLQFTIQLQHRKILYWVGTIQLIMQNCFKARSPVLVWKTLKLPGNVIKLSIFRCFGVVEAWKKAKSNALNSIRFQTETLSLPKQWCLNVCWHRHQRQVIQWVQWSCKAFIKSYYLSSTATLHLKRSVSSEGISLSLHNIVCSSMCREFGSGE